MSHKALGRNVRIHAARHTAAVLMLEDGVPLEVVSAVLGHASHAITMDIYGHIGMKAKARGLKESSTVARQSHILQAAAPGVARQKRTRPSALRVPQAADADPHRRSAACRMDRAVACAHVDRVAAISGFVPRRPSPLRHQDVGRIRNERECVLVVPFVDSSTFSRREWRDLRAVMPTAKATQIEAAAPPPVRGGHGVPPCRSGRGTGGPPARPAPRVA